MFSFLLTPTLLFLAAMIAIHWWTGSRPQSGADPASVEAGHALRLRALAHWRNENQKAADSRASTLRFGMAAPPFGLLIAIAAVVVGKLSLMPAMIVVLLLASVASVFGFLTAPAEIAAIRRFRETRDAPEPVRDIAIAEVWNQSLPPALRAVFGPKRRIRHE